MNTQKRISRIAVCLASCAMAGAAFAASATPVAPAAALPAAAAVLPPATAQAKPEFAANYGKTPISFEPNLGQIAADVRYVARGPGYSMALTDEGATLSLRRPSGTSASEARIRLKLIDSKLHPELAAEERQAGVSNYLIGRDASKWHTNVPNYGAVRYAQVYPGIDWRVYGNPQQFEYDFIVAPQTDPAGIRLSLDGAQALSLDGNGDLLIQVNGETLRQLKPVVYQTAADGRKQSVDSHYLLDAEHRQFAFALGDYDHGRELVIDPGFVYSTYLGGSKDDFATAIAVDSSGNAYVAGGTTSTDFPVAANITPTGNGPDGMFEVFYGFVTKFNAAGTERVYSTYIGSGGDDYVTAIAVNAAGEAYIAGRTQSANFPVAGTPFQPTFGGLLDGFVAKLNVAGNALLFSTYLGGNSEEVAHGIALDSSENIYVTGDTTSENFPVTANALQPHNGADSAPSGSIPNQFDGFLTQFTSGGSLLYSSYLGGFSLEQAFAVSVDSSRNVYVAGYTRSINFPTAQPIKAALGGIQDAFVSRFTLDSGSPQLLYSTYLGGDAIDTATGIAVGPSGMIYVVGTTYSHNFPVLNAPAGSFNGSFGDFSAGFITKLNPQGNNSAAPVFYSTLLGGSAGYNEVNGVAVDSSDRVHVTGRTLAGNFPQVSSMQSTIEDGSSDAFVVKVMADGSELLYSTIIGGNSSDSGTAIAVDASGAAVVAGSTSALNFPTAHPLQAGNAGDLDAFVAKISDTLPVVGLSTSASSFSEAGGSLDVIAQMGFAISEPVTINLGFTGKPKLGSDYSASARQIVIPAGSTSGSITLTGIDNQAAQGDKPLKIKLTSISNALYGAAFGNSKTVTLVDDDDAPVVHLGLSTPSISEANGVATLTATLSSKLKRPTKVFVVPGGSATFRADYALSSYGAIVIPAGSLSASVEVTAIADAESEPTETATFTITRVNHSLVGTPSTVSLDITP